MSKSVESVAGFRAISFRTALISLGLGVSKRVEGVDGRGGISFRKVLILLGVGCRKVSKGILPKMHFVPIFISGGDARVLGLFRFASG